MTKKEPSEEMMIYQSQYSLLGGGRLEGGSDKERSRMVKGSEMKLIKKRSESEVAQSCPTLWDPSTVAPLSMGFSRQ